MTAFGNGTSITGKALNTAFKDIQGQIDSLTATPVGSLIMYGGLGNAIPASFLLCDGSSLSTTTYASLFAVVGYTYGGSGGSFNLPSLVGSYVALGTSSTSASSGVRAGVALTSGNTSVDHTHNNSINAVSDQSPQDHSHANAINAVGNQSPANHNHTITPTNNGQVATHTHPQNAVFTGGASSLHSHGYFKPNGSGANANTNDAGSHFHATTADTTGPSSDHSHASTANAGDQSPANHNHTVTLTNNTQSANHSHTVTLTNNTQSVTHTHASATGALVCFIIKYQ